MKNVLGLIVLMVLSVNVFAEESLEGVALIALTPINNQAVVQFSDKKMQVLKVGDTINGTEAKMLQVLTNKIVLENNVSSGVDRKSKEKVWLHKAVNGKSRVQYLQNTPDVPHSKQMMVPTRQGDDGRKKVIE